MLFEWFIIDMPDYEKILEELNKELAKEFEELGETGN